MKDELKKFLDEKKEIIWLKTRNGKSVKEILKEYLSSFEEKKIYCYSEKQVINLITGKNEKIGSNLYEVLDNLYPLGIKKIPIYLLVEDSYNELVENRNINYLKEIYDMRQDSSRFNFTVIIIDKEPLIEELKSISITIEEKEKKKETPEDWIEEYIINYADDNNLKIKPENFEEIFELLKKGIKKISLKNETKEDPFLKNMVFVKGGKYKPEFQVQNISLFFGNREQNKLEDFETFDIEVCKYQVTQKEWKELMNTNPSKFIGNDRPVENIKWRDALNYCNKLSEKYGLEPVYILTENDLMINQLSGENVEANLADFKDTEGFRLPTELEWEWFARGGEIAKKNGTFNCTYSGSNIINEVAWNELNCREATQDVGMLKPNQLGLYDCSGNIWEWCYDTGDPSKDNSYWGTSNLEIGTSYTYKKSPFRVARGGSKYRDTGSWNNAGGDSCKINYRCFYSNIKNTGFRVIRTIHSKKES